MIIEIFIKKFLENYSIIFLFVSKIIKFKLLEYYRKDIKFGTVACFVLTVIGFNWKKICEPYKKKRMYNFYIPIAFEKYYEKMLPDCHAIKTFNYFPHIFLKAPTKENLIP